MAEARGRFRIEYASLLEGGKSICIKHLGPFVAVIACAVASTHDMFKLHGHTGFRQAR